MHIHLFFFFFFNDTATTEIYTLSLHDALPISFRDAHQWRRCAPPRRPAAFSVGFLHLIFRVVLYSRSEEHTSELQSRLHLVCRLLLEKKKNITSDFSLSIPLNYCCHHEFSYSR